MFIWTFYLFWFEEFRLEICAGILDTSCLLSCCFHFKNFCFQRQSLFLCNEWFLNSDYIMTWGLDLKRFMAPWSCFRYLTAQSSDVFVYVPCTPWQVLLADATRLEQLSYSFPVWISLNQIICRSRLECSFRELCFSDRKLTEKISSSSCLLRE